MPEPRRIRCLLIDDDKAAYYLTQAIMDQIPWADFDLEWVDNYEDGARAIARQRHDVYLVDYLIDEDSGIDLVREMREKGIRSPMILLTGKGRYEVDVEGMEAGLSDYLDKSTVDPEHMERSIRYSIDRVRAEAALAESEARYRNLFNHTPIGLYRTTPDGELLDANPALRQILGQPEDEVLSFDYARHFFVNPMHRQAFLDRLDQFGVVRGFESEIKRPDGRPVSVRCSARAHKEEDGTTAYIQGAVEDVSQELEAREIHGRAARFTWVYKASGLATLVLDLEGTIRGANPAFLEVFGYEGDALVGRTLLELADPEERDSLARDLAAVAEGAQEASDARRSLLTAEGHTLGVRARLGLVRSFKGHPDHILVLFEEVRGA